MYLLLKAVLIIAGAAPSFEIAQRANIISGELPKLRISAGHQQSPLRKPTHEDSNKAVLSYTHIM